VILLLFVDKYTGWIGIEEGQIKELGMP